MDTQRSVARGRRQWPATAVQVAIAAGVILLAVAAMVLAWTAASPGESRTAASATPTTPGPATGATPVAGSEVLPPDPAGPSEGVPPLTQSPPLVSTPLPSPGVASGTLVTGYPTDVAGPLAGDEVIESSVASEGTTLQATLTARTDRTPDEVREHFRAHWSSLGLSPDADTAQELSFRSSTASVTLALSTGGTGTVYTVFAVLRTE